MKSTNNTPYAPNITPNLRNLRDVEDYLLKLRGEIQSGKTLSQDIDFIPIFHAIQEIVNSENLRNIIMDFQNSSDLFSKKIQDIRAYISSITADKDFQQLVKLETEQSLNDMFQNLYNPPFILDDLNLDTLEQSFLRLTRKKKLWSTIEFPDFSDVIKDATADDFTELFDDAHFERDLEKFEKYLLPQLPLSLPGFLKSVGNDDIRYNYFVYCLYLIQRKKVEFDKFSLELRKFTELKGEMQ